MKTLKTFETWNNNIIDNTLFSSGKAKYDPKIVGNSIRYKTGNTEPYYFAEITQKGNKFICKIYKKNKDGEEKRLRNKVKDELKLAHNYVREFLNQRLKKDKTKKKDKKKEVKKKDLDFISNEPKFDMNTIQREFAPPSLPEIKPKSKTIIRRF